MQDIVLATQNFEREIGRGGFGPVYYGILDGQEVAAKVLDIASRQGSMEFFNEVCFLFKWLSNDINDHEKSKTIIYFINVFVYMVIVLLKFGCIQDSNDFLTKTHVHVHTLV